MSQYLLEMSYGLYTHYRREDTLSTRQLRHQLHFFEGRAKCPTVSQRRELVTGVRAAGQGSK